MSGSGLCGVPLWSDGVVVLSDGGTTLYGQGPHVPALHASDKVVVVLGVFDGIHLGHKELIKGAVEDARRGAVPCVAVTFDPDPAEVVGNGYCDSQLLSASDRRRGLFSLGVDYVLVFDFTSDFAHTPARTFVEEVLMGCVRPKSVHVGENFSFGSRGAGNVDTLRRLGSELGYAVRSHELVSMGGSRVSASRIRGLLHEGALDVANSLLGRSHCVRGVVAHGRGEGTSFGFPTANVVFSNKECLPRDGVYACYVVKGSDAWPAAANVGAPPSFVGRDARFLEANLIGFEGDLYGAEVLVTFEAWLRESRKFSSLEELQHVVLENIAWVKENLGTQRLEVHH